MSEELDGGEVTMADIYNLLSFSIGYWGFAAYFLFCFASAFCQLYTTYWVSDWSSQPFEEQQKAIYPQTFGWLIFVYIFLTFTRSFIIYVIL